MFQHTIFGIVRNARWNKKRHRDTVVPCTLYALYTIAEWQFNWRDVKQRDERNIIYSDGVCVSVCKCIPAAKQFYQIPKTLAHPTQTCVPVTNKSFWHSVNSISFHSISNSIHLQSSFLLSTPDRFVCFCAYFFLLGVCVFIRLCRLPADRCSIVVCDEE